MCLLFLKQLRDALIFFWQIFFLCVDLAKLQEYFSEIGHLVPACPQVVAECTIFFGQITRIFFSAKFFSAKLQEYFSGIGHLVPACL